MTPPTPVLEQCRAYAASTADKVRSLRDAADRFRADLARSQKPDAPFTWDEAAAQRAVGFMQLLEHTKDSHCTRSGDRIELAPWQVFCIGQIFGWKRADGTRRFRRAYIEVPRKQGKALATDTPIPTPSGWTTMGDLSVGDWVFDEQGKPCVVVAATAVQYNRPCYRVSFSDGTSIVADEEHEWMTVAKRTGLPRTGLGQKVSWERRHIHTTREILYSLFYDEKKNERNHKIPVADAVQMPVADLPVDPYTLGVWLGNGHSDRGLVTLNGGDSAEIESWLPGEHSSKPNQAGKNCTAVCVYGLQTKLKTARVFKNKHIPAEYLRASIQQRRALLAGLMDTDGTVNLGSSKAPECEIGTIYPALRDGILELTRSLGYKPTFSEVRAMLNGKDYGPFFRVRFNAYRETTPFWVQRKTDRLNSQPATKTRASYRQIVGVDPVESVPVRCIQVSSPNSLYLAGAGFIPTHNSTVMAACALYCLHADGEPGAHVYSAATKRDQARIVWDSAREMILRNETLRKKTKIYQGAMTVPDTFGKFEPLASESDTLDGLNIHCAIVDELHAHKNRDLLNVLETATGSRRQPLLLVITTAGSDRASICWEMHEKARQVCRTPGLDDAFFAYVACVDEGMQWDSPETWAATIPGYGTLTTKEFLQDEVAKTAGLPSAKGAFMRYYLNDWATGGLDNWLDVAIWDACVGERSFEEFDGDACWIGLDLATKIDTCAMVVCFSRAGLWYLFPHFWIPADRMDLRVRRDGVPFDEWVRQGWVTATPGAVTDHRAISNTIREIAGRCRIQEIAIDRAYAAEIENELIADGLPVVEHAMTITPLTAPCKAFEAALLGKTVRHDGNPCMRWQIDNVRRYTDCNENIRPDKAHSADRIDGVVAGIMALGRAVSVLGRPQEISAEACEVVTLQ